jgi:glucan 1,3-beta-glucosidase
MTHLNKNNIINCFSWLQSLTITDSSFKNVDLVLRVRHKNGVRPGVLLDNVDTSTAKVVVQEIEGNILLKSLQPSARWGLGWVYSDDMPTGREISGPLSPTPNKPRVLLKDGKFFSRSKPQYNHLGRDKFMNILSWGVRNDGDPTFAFQNWALINQALEKAAVQNLVLVFPAGTYAVDHTITIPINSRLTGALWSQIMAVGPQFSDPNQTTVLAK